MGFDCLKYLGKIIEFKEILKMQKIVLGLVRVVVTGSLGPEAFVKTSCLESTTGLLIGKIQAMPIWLKYPILILTFLFNILGILSAGHLFQAQPFDQQIKTVEAWKNSRIKLCREFVKFYDKLALFIYFSI